jgi:hypothetical protein
MMAELIPDPMKPRPLVLLFAAACVVFGNEFATAQNTTAPTASSTLPSTEIGTFVDGNLAKLLAPLPTASVVEKNPPVKKPGKKKKKKKAANNNSAGNKQDAGQGVEDEVDEDSMKVPMDVRTQATTLETQIGAQAGTAAPEEKTVYQQAQTLSKLFTEIMDARDAQITAIRAVLKRQEETDATSTDTVTTGRTTGANNASARQQTAQDDNNDINDIDTQWLKTASGYQQQVDYQLGQLRVSERAALMGPAAPAPKA